MRVPSVLLVLFGLCAAVAYGWAHPYLLPLSPMSAEKVTESILGGDFRGFWAQGFVTAQGTPQKVNDVEALQALPLLKSVPVLYPSFYPPTWLLALEPFGTLDFPTAYLFYHWGSIALFALAVFFAFPRQLYAVPLALGFGGFWMVLDFGQNTLALTAVYLLVMGALPRREMAAGCVVALATVKPHFGLLIPFFLLLRRHYVAILWACLTTVLLVSLSYERYGVEVWQTYFNTLDAPMKRLIEFETVRPEVMISLYATLRVWGVEAMPAFVLQGVLAGVAFLMMIAICRRAYDPQLAFAATITATLLITPHAYAYDLVLLILPILVLVRRAQERGWQSADVEATLPVYLAPFFTEDLNTTRLPVMPILIFLLLYRLLQHSRVDGD